MARAFFVPLPTALVILPPMFRALLACFVAFELPLAAEPTTPDAIAKQILAPLIDPVKVATLKGDRPANARLYRVLYWLEKARRAGGEVPAVIDIARVGLSRAPKSAGDRRNFAQVKFAGIGESKFGSTYRAGIGQKDFLPSYRSPQVWGLPAVRVGKGGRTKQIC